MDPLKQLFDLYEAEMAMSPLVEPEVVPTHEAPPEEAKAHPVAQKNTELDNALKNGSTPSEAHQEVHGEVDSSDTESKAKFASSLGRAENRKVHAGALPEPGSNSIFAQEFAADQALDQTTEQDLESPISQEVPDSEQTAVDESTEYDYSLDVEYLQKYGRA